MRFVMFGSGFRGLMSIGVVGLAAALGGGCAGPGSGASDPAGGEVEPPSWDRPAVPMTPDEVRDFSEFSVFSAGDAADGHPLSAVIRVRNTPAPGIPQGTNIVGFMYGTCETRDHGCPVPVQIQVWPRCLRPLAKYRAQGDAYEPRAVRGVEAAFVGDGQLEIETGDATVVVWAPSPTSALRVAAQLRGVNSAVRDVSPESPLPVAGAPGRIAPDGLTCDCSPAGPVGTVTR